MAAEELEALIASGEGETLEVKKTTGQRVDACETLCAFLNKDGGMKPIGVDLDQKGGLGRELDDLERRIVEFIRCEGGVTYATLAQNAIVQFLRFSEE